MGREGRTDGDGEALVKVGIGPSLFEKQRSELDVNWLGGQQLSQRLGHLGAMLTGTGANEQPHHLIAHWLVLQRHDPSHGRCHGLRRRLAPQEGAEQGHISVGDGRQDTRAVVKVHVGIVPQQDADEALVSPRGLLLDGPL